MLEIHIPKTYRQTDRQPDSQTDEELYGMLERCRVEEGGKMFWKFLDPGFLNRWRGDPEKSGGTTNHMLRIHSFCTAFNTDRLKRDPYIVVTVHHGTI